MTDQKKIFFPNLDGLRFFSFLSVFLFHSFYTEFEYIKQSDNYFFIKKYLFGNANIGVNFFFVISGFLITFLLLEEKKATGKIDVLKFWIRRILRIWPLYFFCVFLGFVIFPVLKTFLGQTPSETANLLYYLTFTNNFDFINKGYPDSSTLGVLWSIAVEEQFYLIWPILLIIIPSKHYIKLFILVIIGSWIFRNFETNPEANEIHTLSCMGDLAMGAMGAYLCRIEKIKLWLENIDRRSIIIIYLMFILHFLFREQLIFIHSYVNTIERSFLAFIILMIILEQNFSKNSFFKMSDFKLISKLGTRTYGMYCLQFIGILITLKLSKALHLNENIWNVIFLETAVALLITILISKWSFKFLESPFLNLKNKFDSKTK